MYFNITYSLHCNYQLQYKEWVIVTFFYIFGHCYKRLARVQED
jgi:hypothetical protein